MTSLSSAVSTKELVSKACALAEKSYDPYQKTKVGAVAVATDDMMRKFTFHPGTYVANAAYSPDICAELAAMVSAIADRGPKTRIVALYVTNEGGSTPCGRCLEIIRELGFASTTVLLSDLKERGLSEKSTEYRLNEILPFPSVPWPKGAATWNFSDMIEEGESKSVFGPAIQAVDARENAYCPYSKYQVGASIKTAAGNIYTGCNVENRSRGLTLCAERTAIARAIANEGSKMRITVIFVASVDGKATPCGPCRQVINEFALRTTTLRTTKIICLNRHGVEQSAHTRDSLFPHSFGPEQLGFI